MSTGRKYSKDKLFAKITHTAESGVVGETEYEVLGEVKLSIATDFTSSGTLTIQGRIKNSSSWQAVGTLSAGGDFDSFDIDVYDFIRFNFTVASGSTGVIAASGFFKASASAGGASNAFTTIQPDAGTAPVADSATDTLTFTSADASITITGNSTTDTIDLVAASAGASALDDLSDAVTTGGTVGIGSGAGDSDDGTSNNNTMVGTNAGTAMTTGHSNVILGHSAADADISGYSNVAIGFDVHALSTAALQNVSIGYQAGYRYSTAANNVAVGFGANYQNSYGAGSVCIGYNAGRGINTYPRGRNICIGYQAANNLTNAASDNIVIGYDIDVPSAAADDQLTIGNLIYGDLANERVGINTNTLTKTFHVGGDSVLKGSDATSSNEALIVQDSAASVTFTIRNDGAYAFAGGTVGVAQTGYTAFSNLATDRTCDANATSTEELADILGTLIEDLKTKGIISA